MNSFKDLKRGLGVLAARAVRERKYKDDPQIIEANEKLIYMCGKQSPVIAFEHPDDLKPVNVTRLSLLRVNGLLRRHGIDWPRFNWEDLLDWLYENWDKILRVLLSLLTLVIL